MKRTSAVGIGLALLAILLLLPLEEAQALPPLEQWVARYDNIVSPTDRATALVVDGSGNVYVTGYSYGSGTSYDYATVKYDSDGNQQWAARYNGPGNGYDRACAVAVDGSGNVCVTGESPGVGSGDDYATVKYDGSGAELWVARYNGPGNSTDIANALVVDGSGNVYVTGESWGSSTAYDYATVKYDSNLNQLWATRYNGPLYSSSDVANALAIDSSGNVYVTGYSEGSGTEEDYATFRYDSDGNQQWAARYNGLGPWDDSGDKAEAIAVDGSGNVYVTGYATGSAGDPDYATVKYDSAGTQQWVAWYKGPLQYGEDLPRAIAVDGSGNVYVTGFVSLTGAEEGDYATVKYNSAGAQQWARRYNGPGNADDKANALVVDGSGNVYVTGRSVGPGTWPNQWYDYATVKYDSAGSQQWVARYNGPPGNDNDGANALAVDGSGNVYVTGGSVGSGTGYDYATIKYSPHYQPDNRIRNAGEGAYIGNSVYNTDGSSQTKAQAVNNNVTATYEIRIENDGSEPDSFTVTGTAGDASWTVNYFDALAGGTDITAQVTGGGWSTGTRPPDSSRKIRVEVTPSGLAGGSSKEVLVTSTSNVDNSKKDAVKATTTVCVAQTVATATGTGIATFETSRGQITGLTATAFVPCDTIPGITFPHGFFSFNITGIVPGSTVTITITLPSAMPVGTQYWKCQNGVWVDVTSLLGDDDGDDTLTLTLTDGGWEDADGAANGTIVEPGGPAIAVPPAVTRPTMPDGASTGGEPAPAGTTSPDLMTMYLSVNPRQVYANRPVTVLTNVVNRGGMPGSYTVALKVNGQVEQTRTVTVSPGVAHPVKFIVTRAQPGTYTLAVGGDKTRFTVMDSGPSASTGNGPVLALAAFVLVLLVGLLLMVVRRRFQAQ